MNFVHDHHSPLPMNKLRLFPLANAHYIMIRTFGATGKHCILSVLFPLMCGYHDMYGQKIRQNLKAKIRQNLLLSFFKDCLHILADFVTLSFCHMFLNSCNFIPYSLYIFLFYRHPLAQSVELFS